MTAKIVTEYLSDRKRGHKGLKSPHIKFTQASLRALPTADFDYEVRANEPLSGLICRVRPSGVKTLEVFKKPSGSQKPVRIRIGKVGDLPLTGPGKTVKRKLQNVLNDLEAGKNPNEVRKAEQLKREAESLTLSEALDTFISNANLKPRTENGYRAIVKNHLFSECDKQLASLMSKPILVKLHKRITDATGPVAANNALRTLRAIANYARAELEDDQGQSPIPSWPIKTKHQAARFWHKETRRRGWIKPEHLKDWWEATERLPDEYQGDGERARDYLQFILLSGLRRGEAAGLKWSDIDFKSKSFTIADTKNGKPLDLPCSDYMVKILERRKERDGDGPFQIDEPRRFVNWVRKKSGINFTIHDLRRSFITYAESLDFGTYTIKALVNHSAGNSRDVTEGYLQLSVERLRKPMNRISSYILAKTGGEDPVIAISGVAE